MLATALGAMPEASAQTIPDTPLSVQQPVKPMVMLVSGKDHRLFYEAYNDASDIDGDGQLDLRFKPSITYLGLFNPDYCYSHNDQADNTGLFTPSAKATLPQRTCSKAWSGNWLNYVTTSRIDALRVVLYGGHRDVDTATSTVLRRAYIPQDGHSWAKEYNSEAIDGYRISDYTPLAMPASSSRRHFFGNLTANARTNCADVDTCSTLPPWLSVVTDTQKRVWEWASKEAPVLNDTESNGSSAHGGARTNYTVRVAACPAGYTDGCRAYPNGRFKPAGLLHEYGENDAMLFGLLTGSYDNSMQGGRLRRQISSFRDELDPQTGVFHSNVTGIARSYDRLRIRDFNNGNAAGLYRGDRLVDRIPRPGEFADWGNPMAEMMYESLRYFAGRAAPTAEFGGSNTLDTSLGLPQPAWDDPFKPANRPAAPTCARSNMLVISDTNVSYDSDSLPGSYFGPGLAADLRDFNAQAEAQAITDNEPAVPGLRFVGQAGGDADNAPTAKSVTSLGTVRGLAAEEPTKQGSYYAAAVAAYGKRADLRGDLKDRQNVETFVVALASPLPRIEVPMANGARITLVPFAKSVYRDVANLPQINRAKGAFQPTNQIIDFYVDTLANSSTADRDPQINAGRYYAKFRINFEDVEQGGDHDMDAVAEYEVAEGENNTLVVKVRVIYQFGQMNQRIGYVISGTDKDGVYLEVQDDLPPSDKKTPPLALPYFLDTPKGLNAGDCAKSPLPEGCKQPLPYYNADRPNDVAAATATRIFRPGSRAAATLLKDPLWYAAKWGGFIDQNGNNKPDLQTEWDRDGDGVPDSYNLVVNPVRLREALRASFENIAARTSSASNVSINSTEVTGESMVFQATFNSRNWSGDIVARAITASGVAAVPSWQASIAGPPWQERKLFLRTATGSVVQLGAFSALPNSDRLLLDRALVYNYLRGERTNEIRNGGKLRDRGGVLGDIVHSSPHFDGATKTLYVGANDGMLHAFDTRNGSELFAFIPRASIAARSTTGPGPLPRLSDPAYSHAYFVDGDIIVAPASSLTGNQRYLYALMGRGGRGLFSLRVTDPRSFAGDAFRWEYTPAGAGTNAKDPTSAAATDANLGHMLGRPVLATLASGKLGLIVGNGYNSRSGSAVLYVFVINTDGSLDAVHTIDTMATGENGLAGPAVVDTDKDGKADLVIAGDLKGNVWKFDIGAPNPTAWKVAHGGRPMFTATGPGGLAQPITAPMYAAYKPVKGNRDDKQEGRLFVFFGTGSYFRAGDSTSADVQSWYGLLADTPAPIANRKTLKARGIAAAGVLASGRRARTFASATAGDMAQSEGWYIDFNNPVNGERMVTASKIVELAVPSLIASSFYPLPETPCEPGGRGYLNVIEPFTGATLDSGVLDANRDGTTDDDRLGTSFIGSVDLGIGMPSEPRVVTNANGPTQIVVGGSGGNNGSDGTNGSGTSDSTTDSGGGDGLLGVVWAATPAKKPKYQGRLSWREIVRE